jgi:hemolysin III
MPASPHSPPPAATKAIPFFRRLFRRPSLRHAFHRIAGKPTAGTRPSAISVPAQSALSHAAAPAPPAVASPRSYSRGEELANWLTHGFGLALSVVGLTLLIVFASRHGDAWHVVSFTIFGLTLLALYAASTLYHANRDEHRAGFLQRLDHAAIFLLIAGTYTPFLLTHLRGPWGWTLFGIIWALCAAGAAFKIFYGARYRLISTLTYLFAGWLILVALKPLIDHVPAGALWLLVAGGLCYSVGVIFYAWSRLPYHHAVWHGFVLGGSTCHFLAVLLFLLPPSA